MFENLSPGLGLPPFACSAVQFCPTLLCQGGGRFWKAHISQSAHDADLKDGTWRNLGGMTEISDAGFPRPVRLLLAAAGITQKPVDSQLGLQS